MKQKLLIGDYIQAFFEQYLCFERGVSDNTLRSYAYAIKLLLKHIMGMEKVSSDRVTTTMFSRKAVTAFLHKLQSDNLVSISTCNQRLAAICSFAKYMETEDIIHMAQWHEIASIKSKKAPQSHPNFLNEKALAVFFSIIPQNSIKGRRDLALLTLLYESGARVQELIDLIPANVHISTPASVRLHGKGNKTRTVDLSEGIRTILSRYMEEHGLLLPQSSHKPLFFNNRGSHLTESGINHIIKNHLEIAKVKYPDLFPAHITAHSFRHSRAMHLLNKGMPLIYIRDILGHTSIQTTEIYARIDSKGKREALQKASSTTLPAYAFNNVQERDALLEKISTYGKS